MEEREAGRTCWKQVVGVYGGKEREDALSRELTEGVNRIANRLIWPPSVVGAMTGLKAIISPLSV